MRMMAGAAALFLGLLAAGCNGEVVGGGMRPAAVLVVSGDLQTGTAGQELPQPLVAKVVDEGGRPVRDQLVNFRVVSGGGSVFAGSAITNRDGIAQERWTLGTVAGDTQVVEARAVDTRTGAPIVFATFRAVARAAAPAQLAAENPDRAGTAGAALPAPLVVRVTDALGNGVPGTPVTWTVVSGGGTVQAGGTTDATGRAQAAWTLGGALGTAQGVQAVAAGLPPVRFTALAAPATPLELVQVSGEYQGARGGEPLEHPIVFVVRQAGGGAPVADVWVRGGPGTAPDSVRTDAQGRASFTWTVPPSSGWVEELFWVAGAIPSVRVTAYSWPVAPARMELYTPLPYAHPDRDVTLEVGVFDAAGQRVQFPVRGTVEAGGGTINRIMAMQGAATLTWHTGPQDGSVQRVRLEAGGVDLVVEKEIRRVWLWPRLPAGSVVTASTLLRVDGSSIKLPAGSEPGPGDPRMFVTVDGRTTEMRNVSIPGGGGAPWMPYPTTDGWVAGLAPGPKVARFRLETAEGTFELDWAFV
ncbi:MAG TPA: Ig-like domain-containing protein, partial [Longimicrobium sp.]